MGVSPSDHVIRELEQEAYSALLRAIYAHPHGATDPLVRVNTLLLNIFIDFIYFYAYNPVLC